MGTMALAVVILLAAEAVAPKPVTLTDAVAAAMSNFPAVSASAEEARAARATVREMEAARQPSLNLGASATRYSDPMLATPIHRLDFQHLPEFDETLAQSALTASYVVYDAGAREARIEESRHSAAAVEAATDSARQSAGARAASAFTTVLARSAILDAQRQRIEALKAEQSRVAQLRAVGRAANVDTLRVEAALSAAEADRTDAAASLDSAERTLSRVTGLPLELSRAANLVPPARTALLPPDRAALEARSAEAPTLRQARSRAEAQKALIDFARSGRKPQLSASAQQLFFATDRALLADEWNVALQVRFNIFDGGATSARVARATAAARAAGEQARTAEIETGIAIDRAMADLQQSLASVDSLEEAVQKFIEVARIEHLRLELGAGTQADYLRAEADLVSARASLAAARYRAVAARVELARVAGELDPQWVDNTFGAAK